MTATSDLRTLALQVAAQVEPELLTGAQAAAAVGDLATVEKASATARMFLALRVAGTDAWRGQGHQSAADWLAAQLGISVWEANRQLGTAKRAEHLPRTKEAMRRGDLSPDQADAVTDAATADPAAEDDLLRTAARDTTKHLREEAARRKAAATDDASRERRIHAQRSCRRYTDAEGAWNLRVRGPAIDGVRLEDLLRPFEEQAFRAARRDGVRDTFENRAYDAFVAALGLRPLAEPSPGSATEPAAPSPSSTPAPPSDEPPASGQAPDPIGGDGTTDPAAGDEACRDAPDAPDAPDGNRPRPGAGSDELGDPPADSAGRGVRAADPVRRPGGNNVKVIVRIDHTALARGHTVAGETCEVVGLGPISVATANELMRDAFLAAVVTRGREVVNVAHLGRGLSAHQRTAIEAMGLRCTNLACNRTIALEIDHRVPWADDPVTALDNQDPLCPECHRRKTHHGHHLEAGRGPRRLLPPGEAVPSAHRQPARRARVDQASWC